jgi:hypothetical protein
MSGLILMLAVATAMVLFREPLGRGLVQLAGAIDRKRLAMFVVLLFLVWALLHQVQIMIGPISGDALVALFDTSTYAALFDASAYADLAIGLAAALLSRRTRLMLARLIGLVRRPVHRVIQVARARRTPTRPRRQAPDPDEPEPDGFRGILAFA